MSDVDDIDRTTVSLVDHRLAQGFEVMRDVIESPGLVEMIPDEAELVFRDLMVGTVNVRLTA